MWDIRDVYHVYNIVFSTAVTLVSVIMMVRYYDAKKIRRVTAAVALLTLLQNAGMGVVRLMLLVVFEGWIIGELSALIHGKDDDEEEDPVRDMVEEHVSGHKKDMASLNSEWKLVAFYEPHGYVNYDIDGIRHDELQDSHLFCCVFDTGGDRVTDF